MCKSQVSCFRHSLERNSDKRFVAEYRQPLILTSRQLTSLYDLLERILNGTAVSVLISLVVSTVVIVFTTFHLTLSALAIVCIASVVTITIATVLWFGKFGTISLLF